MVFQLKSRRPAPFSPFAAIRAGCSLPLASISANLLRNVGTSPSNEDAPIRREPDTGVDYPFQFCSSENQEDCPGLAGLG
jgi:hypothetical protein